MLTDELWPRLKRLIPARERRFRFPGRLPVADRAVLEGILFVARTGISWNALPTVAFGTSCATCSLPCCPNRSAEPALEAGAAA